MIPTHVDVSPAKGKEPSVRPCSRTDTLHIYSELLVLPDSVTYPLDDDSILRLQDAEGTDSFAVLRDGAKERHGAIELIQRREVRLPNAVGEAFEKGHDPGDTGRTQVHPAGKVVVYGGRGDARPF